MAHTTVTTTTYICDRCGATWTDEKTVGVAYLGGHKVVEHDSTLTTFPIHKDLCGTCGPALDVWLNTAP